MRWSRRVPEDLSPSELSLALAEPGKVIDLTLSNPTAAGLAFDVAGIWARAASTLPAYAPAPLGAPPARAAVARYAGVPEERVVLTASTSEAYTFILKLLCDAGAAVAVPAPSYPLVPHLCELEAVEAVRYELYFDGRWRIDLPSLERALFAGARVVVVVSPNNPTGQRPLPEELAELRALCDRHGAALVSDEVFAPYGHAGRLPTLGADDGPLTFVLDGLSKAAGLPQLKLGWISVFGRPAEVERALLGLEWIGDAFLSVGAPVMAAAPELLAAAPAFQAEVSARLGANRAALTAALGKGPVEVLAADGGWYAVLRFRHDLDEASQVLRLARRHGVLVQPGFLYDFDAPRYLVVSLLPRPDSFLRGAAALAEGLASSV